MGVRIVHTLMYNKTRGSLIPLRCRIIKLGGHRYIVWGRFRIKFLGKPRNHVFMDQYELGEVGCKVRSRNDMVLSEENNNEDSYLIAAHIVLPCEYKGKCIFASSGKRVLYDYKKKGDSPSGYFSVMALLYIPNNELIYMFDYADGEKFKISFINMNGNIEYRKEKVDE